MGIFGFGAFGRLVAHHLAPLCPLFAYDRNPDASAGEAGNCVVMADLPTVAMCDVVILAVPVAAIADIAIQIRPYLRNRAIIIDVGSVKIAPMKALTEILPDHVDIVGTHPLFGPQSARDGIDGLKIAVCPARGNSAFRVAAFLRKALRLQVILATADQHDREAAIVQGVTHLIAKVLVEMDPLPSRMTTASFDLLKQATEMVRYDAPEVFHAIETTNPYAPAVRERFFDLAANVRARLENADIRETV